MAGGKKVIITFVAESETGMKLPDNIIMLLSRKAGVDVATPAGSDVLRHDIESATGQLLSLNTVKRLTGVIPYNCAPRPDTLEIIARYMGYPSWRLMKADSEGNVSLMGVPEGSVYPSGLLPGAVVEVTWEPGRRVTLRREPEGTFVVLEAERSKLLPGDEITVTAIVPGFPLLASGVVRGTVSLGAYSAAVDCGVKSVRVLEP